MRTHVKKISVIAFAGWLLSTPVLAIDTTTSDLDRQIAAERQKLDGLLERFTDRHPDVIAARARLTALSERKDQDAPVAQETLADKPVLRSSHRTTGTFRAEPAREPPPRAVARESRPVLFVDKFAALCKLPGVIACFDFEGENPLESTVGDTRGTLTSAGDGHVGAYIYHGQETRDQASVRMDFARDDSANHGAFVIENDAFAEGDRMTVQWSQWFSPELITRFTADGAPIPTKLGGGGPKQLIINEIGDSRGCSFGEIVASNPYWRGISQIYHGCGLWFAPVVPAPIGAVDPSDFDVQPGGDNACRYRYFRSGSDYIYPTTPSNLLEIPALSGRVNEERYHGCIGWTDGQWMTFRLEVDIAFCRQTWTAQGIPEGCRNTPGRLRYWVKYANEEKPWLIIDYQMPLRWHAEHSGKYGRFMFTPYNGLENPSPDKPPAVTLYDNILIARNASDLPWLR